MALNFTAGMNNIKRPEIRRVQGWVEDALPESMEDCMVMVNEMQCFEPVRSPPTALQANVLPGVTHQVSNCHAQGCAPLETVVSILASPRSHVFKVRLGSCLCMLMMHCMPR